MAEKFSRYDSADYLETEEDIAAYLEACQEEGGDDPAFLLHAVSVVARARNKSQMAREAGMSREGLYKALSGEGNPSFANVVRIAKATGLRLRLEPDPKAAEMGASARPATA